MTSRACRCDCRRYLGFDGSAPARARTGSLSWHLGAAPEMAMSAGTLTEAFVAAEYRGVGVGMQQLVATMKLEIVPATAATAELALTAFRQWGKGRHPAKLNFGDCFSYALAKERDCPLLFIGNDFSQTDIQRAL